MALFFWGLLQGEPEHGTKCSLFVDDSLLKGMDQRLKASFRILGRCILVEFAIYVGPCAFERGFEEQVLLGGEITVGRCPRDERCVRDLRHRRSLALFQKLPGGRKYRRTRATFLINSSFLLPRLGHG